MKKRLFLIIFPILLFSFSKEKAIKIYQRYFRDSNGSVKLINNKYFILANSPFKKYILLHAKLSLMKYIKKKFHKNEVIFKHFTPLIQWKKNNNHYIFCVIDKKNIIFINNKNKKNYKFYQDLNKIIEKLKNSNKLEDLKILSEIYLYLGNFKKYNETLDKIIEIKFKDDF